MTIIQLLEEIGLENVRVQYLHDTATGATYNKKLQMTEFRFLTTEGSAGDLLHPIANKVGIVVWVPREKFQAACDNYKAQAEAYRAQQKDVDNG